MNEKMKKCLMALVYRIAFSVGIFLILLAIGFFVPSLTEKLNPVWTKNTNFQKLGVLLFKVYKELFPF